MIESITPEVYVTSEYPGKIQAAVVAGKVHYGEETTLEVTPLKVASDVREQPVGRRETRRGAKQRAGNLKDKLTPKAGLIVSLESGIIFEFRRLGFVGRTAAHVEDVTTGETATAFSSGVRYPLRDVFRTFLKPGGFRNNTIGQTISERLGGDHQDSLKQIGNGISRDVFLAEAAKKAVAKL